MNILNIKYLFVFFFKNLILVEMRKRKIRIFDTFVKSE